MPKLIQAQLFHYSGLHPQRVFTISFSFASLASVNVFVRDFEQKETKKTKSPFQHLAFSLTPSSSVAK
jgi:hypothetical protein